MIDYDVISNEKRIGAIYDILRCEMSLSFTDIAGELLTDEDCMKKISYISNNDLSNDMLFRLYYMSDAILKDKKYLSEYVVKVATRLKELTTHEISKR